MLKEGLVIGISGKISSGKTTLAKGLSDKFRVPVVSFGDYVRHEASSLNVANTRKNLQELGEKLIVDVETFCLGVLQQTNWHKGENLIIEGIRHTEALDFCKSYLQPFPFIHIHIDIDTHSQISKMARNPSLARSIGFVNHSTESQLTHLIGSRSDILLKSDRELDKMINEILKDLIAKGYYKN